MARRGAVRYIIDGAGAEYLFAPDARANLAPIANRRVDLSPPVTHRFSLDDIHDAFDLFSKQSDGVLKVALFPTPLASRRERERDQSVVSSR